MWNKTSYQFQLMHLGLVWCMIQCIFCIAGNSEKCYSFSMDLFINLPQINTMFDRIGPRADKLWSYLCFGIFVEAVEQNYEQSFLINKSTKFTQREF